MNGLLIQWGILLDGRGDTKINILDYSTINYTIVLGSHSTNTAYYHDKKLNSFYANIKDYTNELCWLTIGY